jgi:PEGA domain
MRIAGFFLGFLFLNSTVLGYPVIAQVTPQPTGSATSETNAASNQTQANVQEPTGSTNEKDDNAASDGHKLHLRVGTIWLGAGYSHFSGPAYYPYGAYPFPPLGWEYSAFWFPYWGPYSFFAPGYFAYGSAKGEVNLAAEPKTAEVYLDRAYAGTANHLQSIWLEPGAYDLSLVATGREDFHRRIYVLSGKSLKISAKLPAKPRSGEAKDKP